MLSYKFIIINDISLCRDHKYSIDSNYLVNSIYKFIRISNIIILHIL